MKLAIDVMGGDFAPSEIVKGVNLAMKEDSELQLVLYGDEKKILEELIPNERITIVNAPEKIDMGEKDPIYFIRRNPQISLVQAFKAVKEGQVDGVVTAGPTQGVVVGAHMIIKRIPGMSKVALCPELPNLGGKSRILLDSGANIELKSEHYLQFARYATIYMKETRGIEKPLVGLLNIGAEPGKGREVDKETYKLLSADKHINFYGNVETKELFSTPCDILLSDGYTGNMVMKTTEGVAVTIGKFLKSEVKSSFSAKIGYLFMRKVFKNFKTKLNPDEVGGATLFGIDGVLVKAHGASNAYAFSKAILKAKAIVKGDVVNKMKKLLSSEENKDE